MIRTFSKVYTISFCIVLLASIVGRAAAAGLPDVLGTPYENAFSYLQERGSVQGYADGLGRPNGLLNRVEALKVILSLQEDRASQISWYKDHMPPLPLFRDINQSAWYGPYIEVAFQEGIITGYPDGTFHPAQILSTEEALVMLMRAFGERGATDSAELSPYIQNRPGEWFTPHINAAITRNLVMHRGTLRLGTAITRGQFFDIAFRLSDVRERGVIAFDGAEPTPLAQRVARPVVAPQTGQQVTGVETFATGSERDTSGTAMTTTTIDHPEASEQYFAISMPSLGIKDLRITHPLDATSKEKILEPLQTGVGHLFSYPGGGGKIMIYGHSSGYPWDVSEFTKIFRRVNELSPGDRIYITYSGNLYVYEVSFEQTIVASNTTPFQDDGLGEELILYTCWPPDSISQRYLVHAVPVETISLR